MKTKQHRIKNALVGLGLLGAVAVGIFLPRVFIHISDARTLDQVIQVEAPPVEIAAGNGTLLERMNMVRRGNTAYLPLEEGLYRTAEMAEAVVRGFMADLLAETGLPVFELADYVCTGLSPQLGVTEQYSALFWRVEFTLDVNTYCYAILDDETGKILRVQAYVDYADPGSPYWQVPLRKLGWDPDALAIMLQEYFAAYYDCEADLEEVTFKDESSEYVFSTIILEDGEMQVSMRAEVYANAFFLI